MTWDEVELDTTLTKTTHENRCGITLTLWEGFVNRVRTDGIIVQRPGTNWAPSFDWRFKNDRLRNLAWKIIMRMEILVKYEGYTGRLRLCGPRTDVMF